MQVSYTFCIFTELSKLMVVGGDHDPQGTEVIDLSGFEISCSSKTNFPNKVQDAVGFMSEGKPTNCGGRDRLIYSDCLQYDLAEDKWVEVSQELNGCSLHYTTCIH